MNNTGKNTNKNGDEFNWNRVFKIVLGWSAILIGFFLIMIYTKGAEGKYSELKYDQLNLSAKRRLKAQSLRKQKIATNFSGNLKLPNLLQ